MILKNKNNHIYFLGIALAIYLFFGFFHLGKFETADEHYWIYEDAVNGRVHSYWDAMKKGNWADTFINDKPGVSLAYVSGISLFFKNEPAKNLFIDEIDRRIYNPAEVQRVLYLFRLPLLIFNGLFSIFLYWLIKKYTQNYWIALWSAILILLSPILLGISQIINPDSLLWPFSIAAILSFLNYLKFKETKFALMTSFFLGFSLLTKYSSFILVPFFLLMAISSLFLKEKKTEENFPKKVISTVVTYILIVIGSFCLFAILFPVIFVLPHQIWETMVGLKGVGRVLLFTVLAIVAFLLEAVMLKSKMTLWLSSKSQVIAGVFIKIISIIYLSLFVYILWTWMGHTDFGDALIKDISFDEERGREFRGLLWPIRVVMEFVPLVFSISPLTLLLLLFLFIRTGVKKIVHWELFFYLIIFLSVFHLALVSQNLLTTIRYSIMAYPIIFVLASLGLWELFSIKKLAAINKIWITIAIIIIGSWSLFLTRPFYFNYTNAMLPKDRIITDAWGYGGYEAAQYLNRLPNANDLIVWVDYNGVCPFFKGKCIKGRNDGKFKPQENKILPDYYVKTRRGSIMYKPLWKDIKTYYLVNNFQPVWSMEINGRPKNYIEIYKYAER